MDDDARGAKSLQVPARDQALVEDADRRLDDAHRKARADPLDLRCVVDRNADELDPSRLLEFLHRLEKICAIVRDEVVGIVNEQRMNAVRPEVSAGAFELGLEAAGHFRPRAGRLERWRLRDDPETVIRRDRPAEHGFRVAVGARGIKDRNSLRFGYPENPPDFGVARPRFGSVDGVVEPELNRSEAETRRGVIVRSRRDDRRGRGFGAGLRYRQPSCADRRLRARSTWSLNVLPKSARFASFSLNGANAPLFPNQHPSQIVPFRSPSMCRRLAS